jgi:hypothetical protein
MSFFGSTQTIINPGLFVECIARYRIKKIIFGIGCHGGWLFFGCCFTGSFLLKFGIVGNKIEFGIEWFFFSRIRCRDHTPRFAME